jgi:selenocysteine lyase/cysteine desulfurase
MERLSELPRITLRSPRPALSGLVSFEVAGVPAKEVAERLLERRFILRYTPEPNSYVRASTHLFNTGEEISALAKAVSRM